MNVFLLLSYSVRARQSTLFADVETVASAIAEYNRIMESLSESEVRIKFERNDYRRSAQLAALAVCTNIDCMCAYRRNGFAAFLAFIFDFNLSS